MRTSSIEAISRSARSPLDKFAVIRVLQIDVQRKISCIFQSKPATCNDLKPAKQNGLKSAAKVSQVHRKSRYQEELRPPQHIQHATDRR